MKSDLTARNAALATTNDQQSTSSISSMPSTSPDSPGSPWRPSQNYTVQQAAALTSLSEHTLRYYERIGLIKRVQRQESSGHRRYGPEDLAKLETLACLRATGVPIDQMRRYFELRSQGAGAAADRQALLSEHLKELHRRTTGLQTHMKYVQLKIDYWRAVEAHDEAAASSIAREAEELIHSSVL